MTSLTITKQGMSCQAEDEKLRRVAQNTKEVLTTLNVLNAELEDK